MSNGYCDGYIVRIGSLVVFQEYEVDRSSNGVRENLRIRLDLLIEIQVKGSAY